MSDKLKIVILSGAGLSVESGLSTFRGNGLWDEYKISEVCTHNAWMKNPNYVNQFYNMLRMKYKDCKPNRAHELIAELQNDERFEVKVITQNVDNLHETAGTKDVLHLHGEIMKMCAEDDVEDKNYWLTLPNDGYGEFGLEVPDDELAGDGKKGLLRPYIVMFDEQVPNMRAAENIVSDADIFLVIGSSLVVQPACNLLFDVPYYCKIFVIDPNSVDSLADFTHIKKTASEGMEEFIETINKDYETLSR